MDYSIGDLLYENKLSSPDDVNGFKLEGIAEIGFDLGVMRMHSEIDKETGKQHNFVFWCPQIFEGDMKISWKFRPISEPGLAMMFFCAQGINGEDLFSPSLSPRNGGYGRYHSGDINCYHASYFRRMRPEERTFHLCNLRKSCGCHLVAHGADPLPGSEDADRFYQIEIVKLGNTIAFSIEDLLIYEWIDDEACGPLLNKGKIGFRQMAPLCAEYKELTVHRIMPA